MSYIASNDNRLYVAAENHLGRVGTVSADNRFAPVRFTVKQKARVPQRRDKTGTRTFRGSPSAIRRDTSWLLRAYLGSWLNQTREPAYGPLFQAAFGSAGKIWSGASVTALSGVSVSFASAHGLVPGQAIAIGGEIRFVTTLNGPTSVDVNAPFRPALSGANGLEATPTITWTLNKTIGTVSIFDYWSPGTALQRILTGAAVDQMKIKINADYHEFEFEGPARDLLDGRSFVENEGELASFPSEPESEYFDAAVIPGHLGQVWLGAVAERFYTLTSAQVTIDNSLETRQQEFGLDGIREVVPGERKVLTDFDMLAGDDESAAALYIASRQRSPMQVMFQLGQQTQQLFGVYMKSVVPEVPEYDDSDTRLAWTFRGCRAQGSGDDEIVIALA